MPELLRYDILTDERVPVTQEWVDQAEKFIQKFGLLREHVKGSQSVAREFLEAWRPEFEQKK